MWLSNHPVTKGQNDEHKTFLFKMQDLRHPLSDVAHGPLVLLQKQDLLTF